VDPVGSGRHHLGSGRQAKFERVTHRPQIGSEGRRRKGRLVGSPVQSHHYRSAARTNPDRQRRPAGCSFSLKGLDIAQDSCLRHRRRWGRVGDGAAARRLHGPLVFPYSGPIRQGRSTARLPRPPEGDPRALRCVDARGGDRLGDVDRGVGAISFLVLEPLLMLRLL
jgi:hypothetical protein